MGPPLCLSIYCTTTQQQRTEGVHIPSGQHCVLGSEAVDGSILHVEGSYTPTLSVHHDQIQGKELDKVVAVVAKGLQEMEGGQEGQGEVRKGEEIEMDKQKGRAGNRGRKRGERGGIRSWKERTKESGSGNNGKCQTF